MYHYNPSQTFIPKKQVSVFDEAHTNTWSICKNHVNVSETIRH